ncbi:MAG: hypothetical protein JRH20_13610 [Deltaproteobacteria bacterium]|nr:hypothetical protein [Deltaproteobacteria bacterium]
MATSSLATSSLALLTLLAASPAQGAIDTGTRTYVLIVANNHSLDKGVRPLRFADDDALRYYELFNLVSDQVELFTVVDNETARLNPKLARRARPPRKKAIFATLDRWNKEMKQLKARGQATELIFIYAGHGDVDKDGEGYVNLLQKKLWRRDLYQRILAPSQASYVHLIIDACKSYFLVNRRGGWKNDQAKTPKHDDLRAFLKNEELAAFPQAGVILATSGDQSTHEWQHYRSGILSHELRSALSGAADINGDGHVEYSEIHAFIAAANARVRHPEARLNIFAHPPAANRRRPLFDLRQARRARMLRFDRTLAGRFHLEDERGVRIADLHKAAGTRFDLAVSPGHSYYIHKGNHEARVRAGLQRVLVAQLAFRPSESTARSSSLDRTFRRDLYRIPFSRGFYEGFASRAGHIPVGGTTRDWVIDRPRSTRRHSLQLGYQTSGALLDLPGLNHGVEIGYGVALNSNLSLRATAELATSSHSIADNAFSLHRAALLLGAATHGSPLSWLGLRAEALVGYQGYFADGVMQVEGQRIEGSDPFGLRAEVAAGVRLSLTHPIFFDLRGGLAFELVTLTDKEEPHATGFVAAGAGLYLD